MTLIDIIRAIEKIIAVQPNIRTVVRNDVYKLNSIPAVKYGVVAWTQETHRVNPSTGTATYRINLYYIDRNDGQPNRETEIVSFGTQVLTNIVLTLIEQNIYIGEYDVQPFVQRFADDCAGVYAILDIDVPIAMCAEDYASAGDYNEDYNYDFSINGIKAY